MDEQPVLLSGSSGPLKSHRGTIIAVAGAHHWHHVEHSEKIMYKYKGCFQSQWLAEAFFLCNQEREYSATCCEKPEPKSSLDQKLWLPQYFGKGRSR